ncbi:uncharacterized protein LOC123545129 [Mercenaria mercenaria]|uniref:uncharacterized protein LOC123545129 n=1 Tax=Mercenaria mercenaria TaxID=6596 RepID=UPI001E1D35CF|nr:uncharacterized protein LOC123545129 [Mercenaria mercenaria]
MSDSEGENMTVYHYTDMESARKIKSSATIKQSTSQNAKDDVTYGEGTYFTDKPPTDGRHSIAKNNYDGGPKYPKVKIDEGKLDAVVQVTMSKDKLHDHSSDGRRVQRYPGDLDLKGPDVKDYKIFKNKSGK